MTNIAFYGSHNSAIAISKDNKILEVIEIERFTNSKNQGYAQYLVSRDRDNLLPNILQYIKEKHGIEQFDNCYYMNVDTIDGNVKTFHNEKIPAKNYIDCLHHESHAACALYQSMLNNAIIVSYDGGGNDGFFNVYLAENRCFSLLDKHNIDLGFPYMIFGEYLNDIKREPALSIGNLVYGGKIMGLASYGYAHDDLIKPFEDFYLAKPDGNNYLNLLDILGKKINVKFDVNERLEGQLAYDIAATSQKAFENIFFNTINPYLEKYDYPVIITGGCALNIILNTKLDKIRDTFIPPNPNDCGLAVGMLLNEIKPKEAIDLTFSGIEALDKNCLAQIVENSHARKYELKQVAELINNGKIIGVVKGKAEHGPRALGNRSIICNPTIPNMKDILNAKVKNREWYRPFAPVVRLEDVNKYFEWDKESKYMSYNPKVKVDNLPAITHVDNTARVQTVTEGWLYDLLGLLETPVLLNTSFNVQGKPLVSTYKDALHVFNNTEMDNLILEDYIL